MDSKTAGCGRVDPWRYTLYTGNNPVEIGILNMIEWQVVFQDQGSQKCSHPGMKGIRREYCGLAIPGNC
jgi:hypothetical protein